MNKIRKLNQDLCDNQNQFATHFGKSPLRRQPYPQPSNCHKSPIRSRTPVKPVSPAKAYHQIPNSIRFISNISPLKERGSEIQNYIELSNGKSLRYINGNKVEKNYETGKKQEYNRNSDRVFQEDNRLFGKLVDKLNSQKKGGLRSNESSHKTSLFAQNSDIKQNRVDPTLRPSGTFKQLISLGKTYQTKSQIKPQVKGVQFGQQTNNEIQNLSCIVYRVKSPRNEDEFTIERTTNMPIANHYSNYIRRKPSKTESIGKTVKIDEEQEFENLDLLLKKIPDCDDVILQSQREDESVKMSMNVQGSLKMNAFL